MIQKEGWHNAYYDVRPFSRIMSFEHIHFSYFGADYNNKHFCKRAGRECLGKVLATVLIACWNQHTVIIRNDRFNLTYMS